MRCKQILYPILWLMFSLGTGGCWRGHKDVEVVRVSLKPAPEEAKGTLWLAEDRPIRCGIEGTEIITAVKVGGYYLIHPDDFRAILKAAMRAPTAEGAQR